jgi:hypothetical protein
MTLTQALPLRYGGALGLLRKAIRDWPQFDSDADVNGADLVDWFADYRAQAKALLNGRRRLYVGLTLDGTARRKVFACDFTPTEQSHGAEFGAVVGPFRTRRGAEFFAAYSRGNPHCLTVADAEKLARGAK